MLSDFKKLSTLLTKREKLKFVILLVLMIIAALFEAASVGAIPVFVAFLIRPSSINEISNFIHWLPTFPDTPEIDQVIWASVILLTFILLKIIFFAMVSYAQARIVQRQQVRLGDRVFRAYQTASYDWFLQRSSSELQSNIKRDTAVIINGVMLPSLDLILAIFISISILLAMIISTPYSTFLSIIFIGLGVFALIKLMRNQLQNVGEIIRAENQRSIKAIQQGLGAFVDARIIGCENYLAKVHYQSLCRQAKANTFNTTVNKVTPYLIEIIAVMGILIVLFFIINSGKTLTESLPSLSVVAVVILRIRQIAGRVAAGVNTINASRPYIPKLMQDLRDLEEMTQVRNQKRADTNIIDDFQQLHLNNISYTYPKSNQPAISEVSLQLNKGESIAFVGSTGCGKSTLINCILGLLNPQSGTITVNGYDIHKDPEGWLNCLGYIPQTIYLVDDTLRANIAFGVKENQIDETRLHSAIVSSALLSFVEDLPKGLDTVVGEHGVRLSGGQRQRLGIARALYFNPQVLVMDEATSALDNQTEAEVMQAIQNLKKERTFIMIAHRLSTVRNCDRLYFLENGKIINSGSYDELMNQSSSFRKMVAIDV